MKIDSNTWHYRVFDWWFKSNHHGISYQGYHGSNRATNLCPYVRAVLLWAPIYFLFTVPRVYYTLGTLLVGFNGYMYHTSGLKAIKVELAILIFLAAVAAFIGAVVGIIMGLQYLLKKYREYKNLQPPKPAAESSFVVLLKDYVKAGHDKICPQITFVDTSKEN